VRVLWKLVRSLWDVRRLLQKGQFQGVFTTGGYIAAPAAISARSLGLPVIFHESNALPGKVTRWLSPWCDLVAIGFPESARYLPKAQTLWVGTPVRQQFLVESTPLTDLSIPPDVPLLVVVGGSQGALAVNKVVRECAPSWLEAGIWMVHQTGENDPDALSLSHPHYFSLPFYQNMAGLLNRADLVISRSGAGTLTELASTHTPSILIPYPYAADDHQAYNAAEFARAGAAVLLRQQDLTVDQLKTQVMQLLGDRSQKSADSQLHQMAEKAGSLAVPDSAVKIASLIRERIDATTTLKVH
jgi:UDP-N-acetylglucosamine--N-acetylmuramyl-(pentapeptide) pyrophosphoryl-undecaprenol N-acetylglucosamine transferase